MVQITHTLGAMGDTHDEMAAANRKSGVRGLRDSPSFLNHIVRYLNRTLNIGGRLEIGAGEHPPSHIGWASERISTASSRPSISRRLSPGTVLGPRNAVTHGAQQKKLFTVTIALSATHVASWRSHSVARISAEVHLHVRRLEKPGKRLRFRSNCLDALGASEVTVVCRGLHVGVPPGQLRTTTRETGNEQEEHEVDDER